MSSTFMAVFSSALLTAGTEGLIPFCFSPLSNKIKQQHQTLICIHFYSSRMSQSLASIHEAWRTWENERNASTGVRRWHGRAVHQLCTTKSPVGYRCNGATRGTNADPQGPICTWAPWWPGVLVGRQLLPQGILSHHHVWSHIRSNS